MIAGNSKVGKTWLTLCHTDRYLPEYYTETKVPSYRTYNHIFRYPISLKSRIWTLPGNKAFNYLSETYFAHVDILFLCYSLDDPSPSMISRFGTIYSRNIRPRTASNRPSNTWLQWRLTLIMSWKRGALVEERLWLESMASYIGKMWPQWVVRARLEVCSKGHMKTIGNKTPTMNFHWRVKFDHHPKISGKNWYYIKE